MIRDVEGASPASLAGFDEIIDVRSPAEFAEDHVPGAVNMPVLTDAQRAEVGTIYVQQSKFLAKRIGAALVARNIADHLEGPLRDRPGSYAPLVYCWRGGQRSNAMATVLSQVGWRVGLLRGGYRTYRRRVTAELYDSEAPLDLVVLGGGTGTGKTAVLARLAGLGVQVLDLEALAAHRGSLFGDLPGTPQPSQKMFESRLLAALDGFDPGRPAVVEAESSRIGELRVPPRVWRAMSLAPEVEITAPIEARARHVAAEYGAVLEDPAVVAALLARLPRHHSGELRALWLKMALAGDAKGLARALIEAHYDPSYHRSSTAIARVRLGTVDLDALDADGQVRAAEAIARLVSDRPQPRTISA
ncbi:MAG TPA: tRNA 2-selenouridine(34) synthase MnmH [Caulobacteraceae bacterium]|jgi:tRNA 2-selenouridine synthase|nr:tRNA 2-selenouridine(34) synthase MnmH [Caulobacteraceae bacterium]